MGPSFTKTGLPMTYTKQNEFTLLETTEVPGGGTLCRYFNFAAATITTIFRERAMEKDSRSAGSYDGGVSVAIGLALTSQMQIQKFSELDSSREIALLHGELVKRGGAPPPLEDVLQTMDLSLGKEVKVRRPLQLQNG
jgi:hypothetical protein